MSRVSRKIGFWSVFALVVGSQIGTGVFMMPASLAPYGAWSIVGWLVSGLGAIALALVFAKLCSWFPKTGGPHVYVKEAFGVHASFFTGWTYWIISWVSTPAVIIASIGYLTPLIGVHSPELHLVLEVILLAFITSLNLRGVKAAGHMEFFLTLLKIIPLLLMPACALFFFNKSHFIIEPFVAELSPSQIISTVSLLTLWGFIGVESATTPAGSVENPSKIIPRAIIFGTLCVASLYLINSICIMGVIPGHSLMVSKAPYADAARLIFGGSWHIVISVIASLVCIGTLNAWVLASGQIALGLAQDGFFPNFFAKKNKNDAPMWSILISSIGILPLLILTSQENMAKQINEIIDFSVISFLFVYGMSCLAFLKISIFSKKKNYKNLFIGGVALIFCVCVISHTPLNTILIAAAFTLLGIPMYIYRYKKLSALSLKV
jgi:APA family basic amino acid/polyamine antiporter